ncbi:MAG: hypothetical protein WC909_01835 [Candidatus Paceibacterota bacterium]|jgi:hypothetical protein
MDLDYFDYGKNQGKILEDIKEWINSDGFSKDVDGRKHTLVVKRGNKQMILIKSFIVKEKPRKRTRNEVFLNEYSGFEQSIITINDWLEKMNKTNPIDIDFEKTLSEEGKGQTVKVYFLIKTSDNGYELRITADVMV